MVEAGILAPIFAMMMMMTVFLTGVYETKYRSAMSSRYAAFSYASNACSNAAYKPDTSDLPAPILTTGSNPSQGDSLENGHSDPTTEANAGNLQDDKGTSLNPPSSNASSSLFTATATASYTWDYEPTYKFNSGPKSVSSSSAVLCNTPPAQGYNIFSYIGTLVGNIF